MSSSLFRNHALCSFLFFFSYLVCNLCRILGVGWGILGTSEKVTKGRGSQSPGWGHLPGNQPGHITHLPSPSSHSSSSTGPCHPLPPSWPELPMADDLQMSPPSLPWWGRPRPPPNPRPVFPALAWTPSAPGPAHRMPSSLAAQLSSCPPPTLPVTP